MTILAKNTCLGELRIVEVYDDYDGPKFFLAKNKFRQQFLCYWVDERDDGNLGWLYMQISDEKLREVVNGLIDARTAFKQAEQGIYLIYTPTNPSMDTASYKMPSELSESLLPPPDVFVEPDEIESFDVESNWLYELSIKRISSNKKSPGTQVVSSVLEKFQIVLERLMHATAKEINPSDRHTYTTYPINAAYGSFEVKFGTESKEYATEALSKLASILRSNDEGIENTARQMALSPYELKELLETIQREKLKIEVKPRFFYQDTLTDFAIDGDLTNKIEALTNTDSPIIPSIKIPQANDLRKVERVVELVASGKDYTFEDFNDMEEKLASQRQVRYYEDAAYALDLLTRNYMLTTAGRFFLSRKTQEARYQVLADRFESSDFGWAWIRWSKVDSMVDLDSETAEDFVIACVPELGEDTARRRATTLVKWLAELKPFHRTYG